MLAGASSGTLAAPSPPSGWLKPRPSAPALLLTRSDGQPQPLPAALQGKVTAVQLMFTGCSSTCPIQGALFALLAPHLPAKQMQLLSISIDALGDTPASLKAWQARFGVHPLWNAALPGVRDVDRLADFLRGTPGRSGTHTSQVFVFDAHGQLAYRTGDAPDPREVAALMARVALQT
jgi:protein SCO1